MIVSNIGVDPGFSAIYTIERGHAHRVRPGRTEGRPQIGSYEYMAAVKARHARGMPELAAFFSSGSLVDCGAEHGHAAPIDVQIAGTDLQAGYQPALELAAQIRGDRGVADVFIPQDLDYPALRLEIDRARAGELGLSEKEVVRQRHHRADVEPDDRAERLDRSRRTTTTTF